MRRCTWLATLMMIGLLAIAGTGVALAHGQKIAVDPSSARPDEAMTITGEGLGHHSEVEVRVIGGDLDVDLGEVNADAQGNFTAQFRVPAALKPGTYQIQAKGAETATADLNVLAPGAGATMPMESSAPILRERPLTEAIVLVALFGVVAAVGLAITRTVHLESSAGRGRTA